MGNDSTIKRRDIKDGNNRAHREHGTSYRIIYRLNIYAFVFCNYITYLLFDNI
jgi:hypothetical protein